MIRRRVIPKNGDVRRITRRAWCPIRFIYNDELVWCWLEKYVEEQKYQDSEYHSSVGWKIQRRLLLTDALLEKLNPPPVPIPTPAVTVLPPGLPSYSQIFQQMQQPGQGYYQQTILQTRNLSI